MAVARTPPPCRMFQKTTRIGEPRLLVEPDLLQATAVVRHLVRDQVLHVGIVCEAIGAPAHGGPGRVLLELLLDLPDERQPLRGVDLLRLLIDQPAYLLVAVVAVVAGGPAREVLVEVLRYSEVRHAMTVESVEIISSYGSLAAAVEVLPIRL